MTATTQSSHPFHLDVTSTAPIPFGRLLGVEWRKLSDTRAGRWLLIITAAVLFVILGITVLVAAFDESFPGITSKGFLQVMLTPVRLLLPILAVITVTAEWSQRTALSTFAHEPRRGRIIAAKALAVTLLALATIAVALVLALVGTALTSAVAGLDPRWNLGFTDVAWEALPVLLWFLAAFGLGMLLLNTPFAIIVVYAASLVLPFMVYTALMVFFSWARDVVPFLDMSYAWGQIQAGTQVDMDPSGTGAGPDPIGAMQWVQAISSAVLWVVLPTVLGYLRVSRSEVK